MSRQALVVFEPGAELHVPTMESRQQVVRAVACGVSEAGIAFLLQVDLLTLHDHYKHELQHGVDYFRAKVGSLLLDSAERGDVNAQRFYLERMAGWAAPERQQTVGKTEQTQLTAERKRLMDSIVGTIKPKPDMASTQQAKQRAQSNGERKMQQAKPASPSPAAPDLPSAPSTLQ